MSETENPAPMETEKPIEATDGGRPEAPAKTELAEQIDRVSERVSEPSTQPIRYPTGRHKKNCPCPKCTARRLEQADSARQSDLPDISGCPGEEAARSSVSPPASLASSTQAPVFDEASVAPIVDGFLQLLHDFSQDLIATACQKKGKTLEFTKEATEKAGLKPATRSMIRAGALGCIRKYQTQFQYVEETAFFGGMAVFGISTYMQFRLIMQTPK